MLKKYSVIFVLCLYINSCSSILLNTTTVIEGNYGCIVFQLSSSLGVDTISISLNGNSVVTVLPSINKAYFDADYLNRTTYTGNITAKRVSFCLHLVTFEDKGCYDTTINNTIYSVKLQVFVPVSLVTMTSLPNNINPVTVIENDKKTFQCKTNPVYPSPVMKWYLDGRTIENATTTINGNTNLEISTSNLTYTGNRFDDQKMLYCTAENIVSVPGISSENKTINIRYGPKDVVISPPDQNYTVLENIGNIGPIQCTTKCKPDCEIMWSGPGLSDITTSVLHVINITRNRTGRYHCIAKNVYGSRPSVAINVIVNYAPSGKPSITQYPASIIKAGIITLTCELAGGSPLARLSWDCSGDIINNSSNTLASYSLSLNVSKTDNGRLCNCSASHTATTYTSTAQHKINVFFAPENPLTITQSPIGPLDTGTNVTLTCEVSGGNPVAELYWNCGSNFTNQTSGNKASYSSNLQVNSTYNGKNCTCSATHPDKSYKPSEQYSLIVYYPPSSPDIRLNSTLPLFEGNTTNAKCVVIDIGNPKFTTMWKWNQTNLDAFKNETISIGPVTEHDNGNVISCSVHSSYTNRKGLKLQARTTLAIEYYPIVVFDPKVESRSITKVEGSTLNVKCLVHGNPTPIAKWFYGEENKPLFEGGQQLNLTIPQIKRHEKGRYYCRTNSTSAKFGILKRSAYFNLIVHYPPDVNINYTYTTEKEQELVFVCNASGIPTNYTYTGWKQTYSGIVIRNSEKLLMYTDDNNRKLTLRQLSFKDSGNYTCFVSNGVHDVNEELLQFGSKDIYIKGKPELLEDLPADDTFSSKRGGNITVDLKFISFPEINEAFWYKNSTTTRIKTSLHENISASVEMKTCETTFYSHRVNVSNYAYQALLKIENLDEQLEGEYILVLKNGFEDKNFTVFVVISSKPDDPSNINITETTSTGITLSWNRGYSGGHTQYFNISVYDSSGLRLSKLINDNYTEIVQKSTINDLNPSSEYVIHLYSHNRIGSSNVIKLNATTEADTAAIGPSKHDFPAGAVVGGVTGLVFAGVVIVVIIYIKRRPLSFGKDRESTSSKKLTDVIKEEEKEDDDGLKDNILYESAGHDFTSKQGASGVEYAIVTKNKEKFKVNGNSNIQETSLYSEVIKKKQIEEKDEVYTNVVSSMKTKKKAKGTKNENREDVYENMSGKAESVKSYNPEKQQRNKDGLVYADLVFNPSLNGPKFIHGLDDRTIYADVDTTQKIDPLPDSDKEETTINRPIEVTDNI